MILHVVRLDYVSCVLTIGSTILVGRKQIAGWWVAALNSVLICLIGMETRRYGFVPANLFCLGLYAMNIRAWRREISKKAADKKVYSLLTQPLQILGYAVRNHALDHSVGDRAAG